MEGVYIADKARELSNILVLLDQVLMFDGKQQRTYEVKCMC